MPTTHIDKEVKTRRAETDKQQKTCQELLTYRVAEDVKKSHERIVELPKLRIEWDQINIPMSRIFTFIFASLVIAGGIGWNIITSVQEALKIEHDPHFISLTKRVDSLEEQVAENKKEDSQILEANNMTGQSLIDHEGADTRNFNVIEKHLRRDAPNFELLHE